MKRFFFILLTSTLAVGLLAGCGSKTENSADKEPYKIGAVLDISGASSSLGIPERDSMQMLVDEINAKGGINGHQIELIIEDDESNETKANLAAKKLIQQDKVSVILGSSSSGPTMAMLETAQSSQIPLVSSAASIKIVEPVDQRKWVFKTAQSDSMVADKIIEYLKTRKITKVAFMSVNSTYGDSGKVEFGKAAEKAGIQIIAQEKFEAKDTDMTAQLTKIKGLKPEAIIVWATPPSASNVAKSYRTLGINAPMIQSHGIGNQAFIDGAGDAANGVIFPTGKLLVAESLPDNDPRKEGLVKYAEDYETKFKAPRSTFGGHGYDALLIVIKAMEKAGNDPAKIRDELEKTANFNGITGTFNMSPKDHNGLKIDALVMVEIKDKKWTLIKE